MTCINCKEKILITDFICGTEFYWCQKYHERCDKANQDGCNSCKIITNADKIRNMTDEELAKFLADGFDCEGCELSYIEDIWHETHCNGKHNECWKNLLEWLKQPME